LLVSMSIIPYSTRAWSKNENGVDLLYSVNDEVKNNDGEVHGLVTLDNRGIEACGLLNLEKI
jgi:hypothetical protein